MPGVLNSTPLIYLDLVGDLDLLQILLGQVIVPDAVVRGGYRRGRGNRSRPGIRRSIVFLDDQVAVLLARSFGLEVVRTPSGHATAKKNGLIEIVRPKIDALRAEGFWLTDSDYFAVLAAAGARPARSGD